MNWPTNSIDKLDVLKKTLGNRDGPYLQWMKEYEDDSKLRICYNDLSNGIPTFSSSFNDLECGIACLAGNPNAGKSTVLVNLMLGLCQNNNDVIVVDISLDDPYKKRYQQYIAAQTGLYYQEITTRTNMTESKMLAWEKAEINLRQWYREGKLNTLEAVEKEVVEDLNVTRHYRDPQEIFRLMRELRSYHKDKKIVIFLDAWNNLDMTKAKGGNELAQANYALARFQEEANTNGVILFLSAHLRKGETNRKRPRLEDIKGTSDMAYNAVWAGLVINELKEGTQASPLVYRSEGKIYPILVTEQEKTKCSTWEEPLMHILNPGCCGLTPLHNYQYGEYRDQYYSRKRT